MTASRDDDGLPPLNPKGQPLRMNKKTNTVDMRQFNSPPPPPPFSLPSLYRPEMCDEVIEMGKQGMTVVEMGTGVGVGKVTFNKWRKDHPEFNDAVIEGLAHAQSWWESQGRVATFGGIDGFNATSYIFQMKNRFRDDWRDAKATELTGKDGGAIETKSSTTIDPAGLSDDSREALRAILMEAMQDKSEED